MKVLGIDPSLTGTGIAILNDDNSYRTTTLSSNHMGAQRLIDLRSQVVSLLQSSPDMVILENYAFAAANQAHQVGEWGGVLRVALQESDIPWATVAPTQLKKFTCGTGNAPKSLMLQQVYKRWGVELQSDDEADAYSLARLGIALCGHVAGLTALQLDVVEEVRNGGKKRAKKAKKGAA
jgi:Holliday junction resolvasome RuvABC endonuclease subunit